ncbi:hypothetical protein BV25DRAFT_1814872 [Artomyces pyxidatus]|uniref:Uncharacterized protein n=1 Tax=Artomyces pyxidatus TaxID=48021 RepID=A0ACB8SI72_9AGAM|nr:hypothetical protein BV25DRAFT_1814872 [Artomyces pyxidatus]
MSVFAAELAPYKAPRNFVARFAWRWRLWFEATFVFTLLEPWEKGVLITILGVFLTLFLTGIYKYLPYHLAFVYQRGKYYLLGTEQGDWSSVQRAGTAVLASLKTSPVMAHADL